nr:hypothetical protein [Bacilli bacterium]
MKTALKLIFDDPRLFYVLVAFLLLAVFFHLIHQPVLVAIAIWIGILVGLINATTYAFRVKKGSK